MIRTALGGNRPSSLFDFVFPNTDHVTIPRRFEPLSCSLKRLHASMKTSHLERKYYPGYRHMICIGKTKSTSEKRLVRVGLRIEREAWW